MYKNKNYQKTIPKDRQYISTSYVVIVLVLIVTIGAIVYLPSHHNTTYLEKKEDVTLKMYKEYLSIVEKKENSHEENEENNQEISQFFFRPVAINSAPKEKLMTVRGIGDKLSTQIIIYRNKKSFTCAEDLLHLTGISKKRAKKFRKEFSFAL